MIRTGDPYALLLASAQFPACAGDHSPITGKNPGSRGSHSHTNRNAPVIRAMIDPITISRNSYAMKEGGPLLE